MSSTVGSPGRATRWPKARRPKRRIDAALVLEALRMPGQGRQPCLSEKTGRVPLPLAVVDIASESIIVSFFEPTPC